MRKILRWGGLALAVGGYLALTIWSNTSAGESALSSGEGATRSGMQPFWILIYFGIAMLVASLFVPRKEQGHNGDTPNGPSGATAKPSSLSDRPYKELSQEERMRTIQYVRDQAQSGNLRPRKAPDPAEGSPEK